MDPTDKAWKVAFVDFAAIEKSLKKLGADRILVVTRKVRVELETLGLQVFTSDRAKWLGGGLAEYRYRRDPNELVRFFFFVDGDRCFVVLSAYDKKRDTSPARQNAEIAKARKLMDKVVKK